MMAEKDAPPLRVSVVGPCASGKSTLVKALKARGYKVRQPAQEHSYVPYMWQALTQPDILIYLDVDYENTVARRPHNPGTPGRWHQQQQRLSHARQHCHCYLDTSNLTATQVCAHIFSFLEQ